MAHQVQLVANHFLDLGRRDKEPLDPMKIQKIIYVAHGWNLAFMGNPLVEQRVEAWPYGPVIAELYRDFKKFKALPIDEKARVSGGDPGPFSPIPNELIRDEFIRRKQGA